MPRKNDPEQVLERITSRGKSGDTLFSSRKVRKITDESELTQAEISWMKDYASCLKAVGYSNRYIGNTINVRAGLVKDWLSQEEQQQKIATVQADIVSGGAEHLRRHAVELAEMLLELARRTTDDAVKLRAIESGLDRVGLAKVNKSESIVTKTEREEHDLSSSLFEKLEGLPIDTQRKLAEMAVEMDAMIEEGRGRDK